MQEFVFIIQDIYICIYIYWCMYAYRLVCDMYIIYIYSVSILCEYVHTVLVIFTN